MEIKARQPLSELTTFRIGGEASFFAEVQNDMELKEALGFAKSKNLKVFILGGGSNILISDHGFDGLVIRNQIKGLEISDDGFLTVGAGESWDRVVAETVAKNFAGIECLSGVPGTAGGAVVQNIGAYGQTIADSVVEVEAISIDSGEKKIFQKSECAFTYRNSIFKKIPSEYVVTKLRLKLEANGKPNISYAHVQKHFSNKPNPTLADLRDFIIKLRASKGYLIMPGFECYQTAGSYFKNPVVSREIFEKLKPTLGVPELNRYWEMPNGVKIAAAFLMQEAGFAKGYKAGSVGISPKHSLSLINLGNAQASDIQSLAEQIKQAVQEKFGVKLEEEILFV
ncbi:MAG: UDP-N-acetylmuramate dehydrogenase [Candidatus Doudnabacteria bacterium]|nr:UDP-N-acetylmuramate dehydrogenase [Candidatus Doudnabacteria bacterium]